MQAKLQITFISHNMCPWGRLPLGDLPLGQLSQGQVKVAMGRLPLGQLSQGHILDLAFYSHAAVGMI